MGDKALAGAAAGSQYSPEEWALRVDFAAMFRLAAHFEITDFIYTHGTARVPGEPGHFLINPHDLYFDEITASSLIKMDLDGNMVEDSPHEFNQAGFVIHSAVLRAREDVQCTWHAHTMAGAAVSAQACGLLPISQYALQFYNRVAYHDYEGLAFDRAECERLGNDLGDKQAMILRNHGLLTAGRSVAETFVLMYNLYKACLVQVSAQAGGELKVPSAEVCEHTAQQFAGARGRAEALEWPALLRLVADQREDYAR